MWVFFEGQPQGAPVELSPGTTARRLREGRPATQPGDRALDPALLHRLEDAGFTVRTTSRWLHAASVDGGDPADLASMPGVRALRPVARGLRREPWTPPVHVLRDEPPPSPYDYGPAHDQVTQIRADALHGLGYTGAGVVVALTDTGFRLEHEALAPLVPRVLGQIDTIQGDTDVDQNPGDNPGQARHGTIVLSALAADLDGTLVGVAPGVSLLLAKTERVQFEEPIEEDYWIAGVEWAEAAGAEILTSSLGWFDWYTAEEMDGATATSTQFVNALVPATGLLITVSAANRGPGAQTLAAPADSPWVLAVAAATVDGGVTGFSSRGPTADGRTKPDLAARGSGVWVVDWQEEEGLDTASGTSLAAPLVAGAAALLREAHPAWTRQELVDALRSTASQAEKPDNNLGWGIVDVFAACGLRCSCRDEDGDGAFALDCGGDDCDDLAPSVHPGADELCNGVDDACTGLDDSELDADGDGSRPCGGDCDDGDPTRTGLDADGDGQTSCAGDCDDADPGRSSDLPEIPYDGVDQDCDGLDLTDQDGDGFAGGPEGPDCRDRDAAAFPAPLLDDGSVAPEGGHELCSDGRDNDCDGRADGNDPDCATVEVESSSSSSSLGAGCTCSSGASPGSALALLLLLRRRRRHMVPGSRVPSFVQ